MNKLIFLIVSILGFLPTKVSMSKTNRTCFFPKPEDSAYFSSSVVVNDKYLAVGDTGTNKVIIYTPDDFGKWSRTREILPPVDLTLDREGSIFGNDLELDGDTLVIGARTKNEVSHLPLREQTGKRYSYWRYLINLNTDREVELINLLLKKERGLVQFNLLRKGKIEQFILSDMGERVFGCDIALHQNLFLVGSPSYTQPGGAWLFNLEKPEAKPLKLFPNNVDFATGNFGETVAISQQFAAVGHGGRLWRYSAYPNTGDSHTFTKTLITNLINGSTKIIDSYGELSLSNNILAIMRPPSPDGEYAPLLEVFRLDENTNLHLIIRRENVSRAWVQNGFLILVKDIHDFNYSQVCIEPIH